MRQAYDANDMATEIRYWSSAWMATKISRWDRFWNWYSSAVLSMRSGPTEALIYADTHDMDWAGIVYVVYSSRLRPPILIGERLPSGETTTYYASVAPGMDYHTRKHIEIVRKAVEEPNLYDNLRECNVQFLGQLYDAGGIAQWTMNKMEGQYDGEKSYYQT